MRIATLVAASAWATGLAACGSTRPTQTAARGASTAAGTSLLPSTSATTGRATAPASTPVSSPAPPPPPPYPVVLRASRGYGLHAFVPVATVRGLVAARLERVPAAGQPGVGVTVVRFDQRLVQLVLHAGAGEPGGSGWPHGAAVGRGERSKLLAAFNGGFKFSTGAGGFAENGRVGAALKRGLASVVTYKNGFTDVGAWRVNVPVAGAAVASVRQNLTLLIDNRRPAGPPYSCISCWGATLGGGSDVARAGLGITASGGLVWAGGEGLSVAALAHALLGAGVIRALELDINPSWVAGYLYIHRRHARGVSPRPLLANQTGSGSRFLSPYGRDYFTIVARG